MSNDLVPAEAAHDWTSGAGIFNDASLLLGDYNDGADAFDWTFDGVSAGLDVLLAIANPFGSAVAAGVGWILENIPGISDLWNMLEGDPAAIRRAAETWANIAQRLNDEGHAFAAQASAIEGWEGPAAESFKKTADGLIQVMGGVASDAQFLSIVITGVGAIVAALRQVVYWAISTWLCEDVIPEAIAALASSWCTFGGSLAAFFTWLIITTSLTSAALAEKVGAAGVKVAEVYVKIGELLAKLGAGKDALQFGVRALEGAAKAIDNPWVWGVRGVGGQADSQHKESRG
jgi:hypothetical protein